MDLRAKLRRFRRPLRRFLRSQPGQHWTTVAALTFAISLLGYAGWDGFTRYQATHRPHTPSPRQVVTSSTDTPNETKIDTKTADYQVAADLPRLISLPSIGIEGFLQQVGVDPKAGAVAVPSNIHMGGWYTRSAKPGERGVSLIDGHVQGSYLPGIFKGLAKLQPGQTFIIEYGDGSRRTFKVVKSTSYNVADAAQAMLAPVPGISNQLNLITCTGNFDQKSRQYEQRLVVVGKLTK